MYYKRTFHFQDSNEVEFVWKTINNLPVERSPRQNTTSPEVSRNNNRLKYKKVRRLLKENFPDGFYFTTLKFPVLMDLDVNQVQSYFKKFIRRLKRHYSRYGVDSAYIIRYELSNSDGYHIHLCHRLLPQVSYQYALHIISTAWDFGDGYVELDIVEDPVDVPAVASYLTKQPSEEQLALFDEHGFTAKEIKILTSYSRSRGNLHMPEPTEERYLHNHLPNVDDIHSTPGYYLDGHGASIITNTCSGFDSMEYTEWRNPFYPFHNNNDDEYSNN